jgi:hypothetical protein
MIFGGTIVCSRFAAVLRSKFVLPLYWAVMECVPRESVEVVKLAVPAFRVPVPRTVEPSENTTVPAGVPAVLTTAAVNVTACPK